MKKRTNVAGGKKLILSRKGSDSSSGGGPSPIIEGYPLSVPIPQQHTEIRYRDLRHPHLDLPVVLNDLYGCLDKECHLDPDLFEGNLEKRPEGWRPAFGQHGSALSHLDSYKVGRGDIFLFFGWFKEAKNVNGRWCFHPLAADIHFIYGYMEIGEKWMAEKAKPPKYLANHPHIKVRELFEKPNNCIYLSADRLILNTDRAGAGLLPFANRRILTAIEGKRSRWLLPSCFFDKQGYCKLSYHHKRKGEKILGSPFHLFSSVPRGQEFVVERDKNIDIWLENILE